MEPFYWVHGTLGNRHDMLSALMLLDDIRSSGVSQSRIKLPANPLAMTFDIFLVRHELNK